MLHYFIKTAGGFNEVSACTFFGYVHCGMMREKYSVDCSSDPNADNIFYLDSDGKLVAYMAFYN